MIDPTPESAAGRRIGRYDVRRLLGAGGFARVYLAWDPDLDVEVAIKLPKPELSGDAEALERFRREATTAARLRHPNIVTILTVGRLDEPFDGVPVRTPYLVMDYLPDSLAARLGLAPALPEREWLRIGQEVARGLAYAHAHGVVHRDVKPDNVLFGRHGEAVVTDFGIARAATQRSGGASRSMVIGTPEYFSPEQARGLPLDGRTDVYALGVTLYRAATGALPFDGDDWYTIMRQHVEADPAPLRSPVASVSTAAQDVVLRCLEKRPEDRYQSAAELAGALGAAAGDPTAMSLGGANATIALRPGPTTLAVRRRKRVALGGVALFSIAALVAATAIFWPATTPTVTAIAPPPVVTLRQSDSAARLDTPLTAPIAAPRDAARDTAVTVAPAPVRRPPPPVVTSLAVVAPTNAAIFVDERYAGSGGWRSDSIGVGRHIVRATVPSELGCSTSTREASVDVRRGDQRRVSLVPIACGRLELSVSPDRAVVTVVGDDTSIANVRLPLERPLVLPEGRYRLTIEAAACATYTGTVDVDASKAPEPKKVALVCS